MLNRLNGSNARYIYLHHERMDKFIVVYWFGRDEELPGIRISFDNKDTHEFKISRDWRSDNRKRLRAGEPQNVLIELKNVAEAQAVDKVELITE